MKIVAIITKWSSFSPFTKNIPFVLLFDYFQIFHNLFRTNSAISVVISDVRLLSPKNDILPYSNK